ncbi:hypothetical protein CR513_57457, partial [Mucuna pruriens]
MAQPEGNPNKERLRDKSRQRAQSTPSHKGTIATISGGGTTTKMTAFERKRCARSTKAVQAGTIHPQDLVISFSDTNYEDMLPQQDDPMVISVVATKYKVERVLIDQGYLVEVRASKSSLKECSGVLIGFAGEHVEIRETINLRTFGMGSNAKAIMVKCTARSIWEESMSGRTNDQAHFHFLDLDPHQNQED